ncbi:hypothetical protein [Sphingomonas sp. 28-63-12]|uniref:hypothetical protein n=1 Tax=Sphingomonas sp. 28-63-12 TaxID=1970434 RepID=UPI0035A9A141
MSASAILYKSVCEITADGTTYHHVELARGPLVFLARAMHFKTAREGESMAIKCGNLWIETDEAEALVTSWFGRSRQRC